MEALNVYDYGAIGNGIADDTAAIQAAIDDGAQKGLLVKFLPGVYSVGELFVRKGSVLLADPTWGYRENGRTQLVQRFDDQQSVLNITDAFCCTINGLALVGQKRPGGCTGILGRKPGQAHMEDSYRLERIQSYGFTGDACRLEHSWAFTIRHCMFAGCDGDGLHLQDSFDGFILDTWFSGNRGCGYGTSGENNAITMSGCRVEWNAGGGIVVRGGSHYQITGNYIDRSGKEGICITTGFEKGGIMYSNTISCTGNVIYRSGKRPEGVSDNWEQDQLGFSDGTDQSDEIHPDSCHIRVEKAAGVTIMGNTMCIGRDDRGVGRISPIYGMRVTGCRYAVVSGNTLFSAALKELIVSENNEDTVITNNPGSLFDRELEKITTTLPSSAAVIDLVSK